MCSGSSSSLKGRVVSDPNRVTRPSSRCATTCRSARPSASSAAGSTATSHPKPIRPATPPAPPPGHGRRLGSSPKTYAGWSRRRSRPPSVARSTRAGSSTARPTPTATTGSRPGPATSPSSCPRGCRSPPWRTHSPTPASPTGPSRLRWCTPAGWSATCCSPCAPSTIRAMSCASSPRCGHRCSAAATTTSSASGMTTAAGSTPPPAAPTRCPTTIPWPAGSTTSAGCTTSGHGAHRASWPTQWSATGGCSSWDRPRVDRVTCGGECGSCSTRLAPGPTPPTVRCGSTSSGCASRPPRAAAWPRPCCPRPTTMPCAS